MWIGERIERYLKKLDEFWRKLVLPIQYICKAQLSMQDSKAALCSMLQHETLYWTALRKKCTANTVAVCLSRSISAGLEDEMSDGDGSSEMTGCSRHDRSIRVHKLTSYHLSTANEPAKFQIDRFLFLVLKHIPRIIRSFRWTKYLNVFLNAQPLRWKSLGFCGTLAIAPYSQVQE